ncbi:enoyl-CoA hydratase/isomerase family protein [Paucibacter sp. APW11]|uniref:Enoyl-CoA hydratase/isomerase family protein n=1 Tax=Roseateles aquae TaxID=3077235 RepID=A0ABU3PHR7_9BURK|nr:enoyl-CoA hydratase/isomerase family protein [Paucibacter sp. APW11]MDT9002110.1 enoyl-CoA hydratase/isomerase family protein [Paucibacter sp. APW11]
MHAWFALPDVGADLIERMRLPTAKAVALLPELQQHDRLRIGPVELERRGDGGYLTFHNLSCLNAEDDALIDAFETAVDLVLLDERIKVGVLRGGVMDHERYRGRRVFSAGINLRHLSAGQISYLDFLLRRELGYINKMAHGLSAAGAEAGAVEKPWIAAVDSFAIGGGAQILLVCDRVIAEQGAYFSLPAAKEGIVPGLANLRLPRLVGARMAGQIILDGRRVSSTETDGRLLFDEVVHPAEMDAAIEQAVERFSAAAVIANRRMLRLLQEPAEALRSYFAQFALEQAQRIYSADVLAKVARV